MPYREFDIVVYGATGFTGKLICEYLAGHSGGAKWAAAGRNEQKIRTVLKEIHRDEGAVIVADAQNAQQIEALVKRTQIVITAAGPFARYGNELVKACANNGVHYLDLTGEPWFVNDIIQKHTKAALQHRAMLVPCSGFDSTPSDLGVYLACKALGSGNAGQVATIFTIKDKFSGGTIQTLADFSEQPKSIVKEIFVNPYILSPRRGKQKRNKVPWASRIAGYWGGFFVMSVINQLIVQRSWGILESEPKSAKRDNFSYGPNFQYYEAMSVPGGPIGTFFLTLFLTIGSALLALKPVARLLTRMVPPGSGASKEFMEKAWYRTITEAKSADGSKVAVCTARGKGSGGYKLTAAMISEAALAIVHDANRLPLTARAGGPLTPSTAFGDVLVERLKKTGLFTFDVTVHEGKKTK